MTRQSLRPLFPPISHLPNRLAPNFKTRKFKFLSPLQCLTMLLYLLRPISQSPIPQIISNHRRLLPTQVLLEFSHPRPSFLLNLRCPLSTSQEKSVYIYAIVPY